MKAAITTLILAIACNCACWAQLTVEECYSKAQANYPLIRQRGLIEKTKDYNLSNARRGYLPQLNFSAQATYQSDVTQIPLDLDAMGFRGIEIPTVNKDQYKLTLDLNQPIWDGGAVRAAKENLRTQAEVDQRNLDVSVYAINERVNQLFFGILLADAQIEQIRLLQDELERNCRQVESYLRNGIANQSDLDALKVDLLKAKQNEVKFTSTRQAYAAMLSQLIGEEITPGTTLVKPVPSRPSTVENNRPELALFDAQIRNLQAQDDRIVSGLTPRLGLFVTGGLGRPGLDVLDDDFKPYYVAGVRLTWNIGGFYTKRNDQRRIATSRQMIETQRETFIFNTSLDVAQRTTAIDNYVEQLKYDDEIIALRRSVKEASQAKMANGTISGTDLTRDINAEQAAIQDKLVHEIELLMSIYNLKYVTNN